MRAPSAGRAGEYRGVMFDRIHDWSEAPSPEVVDAATRRLMAIHAHPDDEASKGAGTVALYSRAGVRCSLVCCTGGEAGDILNPDMDLPHVREDIATVRMAELSASAEICGYAAVYLLGYRDSGMPDTDANAHGEAFVNADFDDAVARLVHIIRAERPHVVLAYDEHKQYPHPDHVMAHHVSLAAFDAAGDADYPGQHLAPWQPAKLYWFHWSFKRMRGWHDEFVRRGLDSPFERWIEMTDDADDRITACIDIEDAIDVARRALRAHRTQVAPDGFWLQLPDEVVAQIHPYDDYVGVRDLTGFEQEQRIENDLFDRVDDRAL